MVEFLPCKTPDAWIDSALANIDILLVDHAQCEKKAASSAMNLIYRHGDKTELIMRMSKIAREELVHFEQVLAIMKRRNIAFHNLSASRYAQGLRAHVRTSKSGNLVDTLIVGAFIEARSCERFQCIAPHLDDELKRFYEGLLASERRHFAVYLKFAKDYSDEELAPHIKRFAEVERKLIESQDPEFRFHSGVCVQASMPVL